ncbi:MAG: hypothetical protein ACYCZV_17070 [Acidimicrobiales bacterium]
MSSDPGGSSIQEVAPHNALHASVEPTIGGLDRQIDGGKEGKTQAGVAVLVPSGGFFEFGRGFRGEADLLAHPASCSASL